jgi:hypothetical protein
MAISDPELLRLQDALRVARERLAMVRQNVDDRAAIKAAEDLYGGSGGGRRAPAPSSSPTGYLKHLHQPSVRGPDEIPDSAPGSTSVPEAPLAEEGADALPPQLGHELCQSRSKILR